MDDDTSHAPDLDAGHVEARGRPDEAPDSAPSSAARRRRCSSYATRDLTKGSVPKILWFLAWPQVTEGLLAVVDQLADLIWVGRLGSQAIAGLGVGQVLMLTIMASRMGLDAAMRAMIARAVGARRLSHANHVFLQSLTVTVLFAAALVAIGLFLTEPMLRVLGLSESVVEQASTYMRVQFFAIAVMAFHGLSAGALQASGDSLTPLKAEAVCRTTHLILSPLLIFGWLGLPAMGLAGVAAATVVARCLSVGMNFFALARGSSRLRLDLRRYRIDVSLIWRMVVVGVPASITGMQRGLSQLVALVIVAPFGDSAVAAFAVLRRVEATANQTSQGLGKASGALAGQNLGAGQPQRARSTVKWAVAFVGLASLGVALFFLVFSNEVASFVNPDPQFVSVASRWLSILALGYFSMSAVQVFTHAFNTSGDTVAPMLVTLTTLWGIQIPLAFALSNLTTLGQFGVPWAIVAGATLRLVVFALYFCSGRWLRTGIM